MKRPSQLFIINIPINAPMNLIKLKSNLQMWYISCLVYLKKYVSTRNCKSNEVRANLKRFCSIEFRR